MYRAKFIIVSVVSLFLLFPTSVLSSSTAPSVNATLVKTIDLSKNTPPAPDSAGITYDSETGRLIIVDSEVDEMPTFAHANIFELTLSGTLVRTGDTTILKTSSNEPTGVAYNPANGHLFFSDDDAYRIYELTKGTDGVFGTVDDDVTYFNTSNFGATDPEGVAVGPNNDLFIADGVNHKIYRVSETGTLISSFDTIVNGQDDVEGVVYNPDTGTLFIMSLSPELITETTLDGALLTKINISSARAVAPADITLAPTSTTTDNPNVKSLYVVDRGVDNNELSTENDGKVYEMLVPTLSTLPPGKTGDLNNDGSVNVSDYNIFVGDYGKTGSLGFTLSDIDKNGVVNIYDYNIIVGNYGK
jgi:uncharacterized protein YjiK